MNAATSNCRIAFWNHSPTYYSAVNAQISAPTRRSRPPEHGLGRDPEPPSSALFLREPLDTPAPRRAHSKNREPISTTRQFGSAWRTHRPRRAQPERHLRPPRDRGPSPALTAPAPAGRRARARSPNARLTPCLDTRGERCSACAHATNRPRAHPQAPSAVSNRHAAFQWRKELPCPQHHSPPPNGAIAAIGRPPPSAPSVRS